MDGKRLGTPPEIPALGAHSETLLAELGYAVEEIARFKSTGAVE
jgi:crotonobetainyl-CoA:carnitine CoA-transferase CaiB-like acyl-CoA transferase